LEPLSDTEQVS